MSIRTFGNILRWWRQERSLTLRELAKLADVDYSNIAKFENVKLRCGMNSALKLADALGLAGWHRAELLSAAAVEFRGKKSHLDHSYPASLYFLVDEALNKARIRPDQMEEVIPVGDSKARVVLNTGADVTVEVRVR